LSAGTETLLPVGMRWGDAVGSGRRRRSLVVLGMRPRAYDRRGEMGRRKESREWENEIRVMGRERRGEKARENEGEGGL